MAFSTAEVLELFEEETSREARLEHVQNLLWCRRFRSGRHEGHDIPKLPREVGCCGCMWEFCTTRALAAHLRVTTCGGRTVHQRRRSAFPLFRQKGQKK